MKVTSSPGFENSALTMFSNIIEALGGSELATGGRAMESARANRKGTIKWQMLRCVKNDLFNLNKLLNVLVCILLSPSSSCSLRDLSERGILRLVSEVFIYHIQIPLRNALAFDHSGV